MPRPALSVTLGIALALAASGCGSNAKTAATTPPASSNAGTPGASGQPTSTGNAACRSIPHPGGLKAVFPRRSSAAAAEALRKQAESRGFQGLDVEENGCGNFYVTLPGLADVKQFVAFAAEAKSAGFIVTLRCEPPPGSEDGITAVFGVRRTHRLAVKLKQLVVHRGFVGADIEEQACDSWAVVVHGLTPKMEQDFAAEARSAGFSVTFRQG